MKRSGICRIDIANSGFQTTTDTNRGPSRQKVNKLGFAHDAPDMTDSVSFLFLCTDHRKNYDQCKLSKQQDCGSVHRTHTGRTQACWQVNFPTSFQYLYHLNVGYVAQQQIHLWPPICGGANWACSTSFANGYRFSGSAQPLSFLFNLQLPDSVFWMLTLCFVCLQVQQIFPYGCDVRGEILLHKPVFVLFISSFFFTHTHTHTHTHTSARL